MWLWEVASLKSGGQVSRLKTQVGCLYNLEVESLFPRNPQFLLLRLSTDWARPIHIMEDNLFYWKSTDYRCQSHLQNTLPAISRLVFGQATGYYCSLARLTPKMNHHTELWILPFHLPRHTLKPCLLCHLILWASHEVQEPGCPSWVIATVSRGPGSICRAFYQFTTIGVFLQLLDKLPHILCSHFDLQIRLWNITYFSKFNLWFEAPFLSGW